MASWASALLLAFCCASCGSGESSADAEAYNGYFRLNLSAEVSSLDPAFADNQANTWAVVQLYNGLLRLGDDLRLEGDLARSWTSSEDGLVYRFALRPDVAFHDDPCFEGRERTMTAEDVAFSLRRLLEPELGADGFWVFNGIVDPDTGFVVLNDSTLEIRLLKPFRPFLSRLAMPYCSVLPPEAVAHYGTGFRNHPVGTGPFRLTDWKEGERLLLQRHQRYFRQDGEGQSLPYLDGVQFSFMASKGTEFLEFQNGRLDFVSDLDADFLDRVLTDEGLLKPDYASTMQLLRGPYFNTEYLGINLEAAREQGSPLADLRVRQALNLAIDRERMLVYQRNGKGDAAKAGMVPPALLGVEAVDYGFAYRPKRAAALLAEAGYPGGQGMPEMVLRTNEQYLDLCAFLSAQWQELGIPVRLETMDGKVLRETMVQGQSLFFRASWIVDYPDPESYLTLFVSEHGAPPNYTRFADPAVDAAYAEAVRTEDPLRQQQLYRAMDSMVMAQAPIVPLYYDEVLLLTKPEVEGLRPNPMNLLRLESVRKAPR
jgi:peptide/nickel transport system substrate-binding protein